jgi:hypothetical protein
LRLTRTISSEPREKQKIQIKHVEENSMTIQSCAKVTGAIVILLAIALAAVSMRAPRAQASDDDTDSRVRIGFQIAPVPLNLDGKDSALVGLGSYLVNAIGDCNGCHSSGAPPLGFYNFVTGFTRLVLSIRFRMASRT